MIYSKESYYLTHSWEKKNSIHTFSKGSCAKLNKTNPFGIDILQLRCPIPCRYTVNHLYHGTYFMWYYPADTHLQNRFKFA